MPSSLLDPMLLYVDMLNADPFLLLMTSLGDLSADVNLFGRLLKGSFQGWSCQNGIICGELSCLLYESKHDMNLTAEHHAHAGCVALKVKGSSLWRQYCLGKHFRREQLPASCWIPHVADMPKRHSV